MVYQNKPTTNDTYRLPMTTKPISYHLEITPDIYSGKPYEFKNSGYVEIRIVCLVPTTTITLHGRNIYLDRLMTLKPVDINEQVYTVLGFKFDVERDFIFIDIDKPLISNKEYMLKIEFGSPILENGVGIFAQKYTDGNETK